MKTCVLPEALSLENPEPRIESLRTKRRAISRRALPIAGRVRARRVRAAPWRRERARSNAPGVIGVSWRAGMLDRHRRLGGVPDRPRCRRAALKDAQMAQPAACSWRPARR
jgi:hypothetical protein